MAGTAWSTTDDLIQLLQEEPYEFGFYQAMRTLEALHEDKPRFGKSRKIKDDPIRVGQEPSMEFAPSTLATATVKENSRALKIGQYFHGLLGPNGPLPLHLTEYTIERTKGHQDATFQNFLDIFHHRLGMLFYRIWADAEPAADINRPHSTRYPKYIGSMFGLGLKSMRDRDALSDMAKFYLVGRYSNSTKNPGGLIAILLHLFEIPVRLEEFSPEWLDLPANARCYLGSRRGAYKMGQDVIIGSRVLECQFKFRLVFGPMKLEDFHSLMPSNSRTDRFVAAVRNYVGDEYMWDYQLILKKDEVPALQLGRYGQLGWTTWLNTDHRTEDVRDFVRTPHTC